jgi:hypothetical protein
VLACTPLPCISIATFTVHLLQHLTSVCVVPCAGSPIPYSSLRSYCKKDPASSWGAYVAGCLLVLAREKGVAYADGISILVCSDVPEGRSAAASVRRRTTECFCKVDS